MNRHFPTACIVDGDRNVRFQQYAASQLDGLGSNDLSWINIGSLADAFNIETLAERKICYVLSLAGVTVYGDVIPEGISYSRVDISDHPGSNILHILPPCYEFIERCRNQKSKILIHCASGISRSVTICAMYVMMKYQVSGKEALTCIQRCRSCANPNIGFRHQIHLLETSGGDVQKAVEIFQNQNSKGRGILATVLSKRARLNDLHRAIDERETNLKGSRELTMGNLLGWKADLEGILAKLVEEEGPRHEGIPAKTDGSAMGDDVPSPPPPPPPHGYDTSLGSSARDGKSNDKPNDEPFIFDKHANMTLKSAKAKCARLLCDIDGFINNIDCGDKEGAASTSVSCTADEAVASPPELSAEIN
jgi:serine/threonine/tyrosine-interacting protein